MTPSDSHHGNSGPTRLPRGIKYIVLAVAVLVVFVFSIGVGLRFTIEHSLAALGFTDVGGGSLSIGVRHIAISDMRIGKRGAASFAGAFSPQGLIAGRLDQIELSKLILIGSVTADGAWSIDGYSPAAKNPSPPEPIRLPVGSVDIQHLALDLETPVGAVALAARGRLAPTDDGLRLVGNIDAASDAVTVTSPLELDLTGAGWAVELSEISLSVPGAGSPPGLNTIKGQGRVASSGHGLTGDIHLAGRDVPLFGLQVQTATLDYDLAEMAGALRLVLPDGGLDATVKSDSGLAAQAKLRLPDASALGKGLPPGPVRMSLTINAAQSAALRDVAFDLSYDGPVLPGVGLRGARWRFAGALDSGRRQLALKDCGKFTADKIDMGAASLAKLSFCVGNKGEKSFLAWGGAEDAELNLSVSAFTAVLLSPQAVMADIGFSSLDASLPRLRGLPAGMNINMRGGRVDFPALGAGLKDLAIAANLADDAGQASGSVAGSFGPSTAGVIPLALSGNLSGNLREKLTLGLALGAAGKAPSARVTIDETLRQHTGAARLDMEAADLGPGGLDVLRLLPSLGGSVRSASGGLEVHAKAGWSTAGMNSDGNLAFKNLSLATSQLSVEGVEGAVSLTSLQPAATAGNQRITVRRLLAGLPLEDGKIDFGLDAGRVLAVNAATARVAGGTLTAAGETLPLSADEQHLTLRADGLDLAELLKLAHVDGLSVTGTLDGVLPLRRTGDIITVDKGALAAREPGVLRYDPANPPSFLQGEQGEGIAILRDALKDFHYQTLALSVDGALGSEQKMVMRIEGANPALYGGAKIALNLNLGGALDTILRSSLESYKNPTGVIRKATQPHEGKKP